MNDSAPEPSPKSERTTLLRVAFAKIAESGEAEQSVEFALDAQREVVSRLEPARAN